MEDSASQTCYEGTAVQAYKSFMARSREHEVMMPYLREILHQEFNRYDIKHVARLSMWVWFWVRLTSSCFAVLVSYRTVIYCKCQSSQLAFIHSSASWITRKSNSRILRRSQFIYLLLFVCFFLIACFFFIPLCRTESDKNILDVLGVGSGGGLWQPAVPSKAAV